MGFGSGSDISSVSVASKTSNASRLSTSSKMSTATKLIQRARSASKDRLGGGKKDVKGPFGPPGNANAAFDKYFDKAEAGPSSGQATPSNGAAAKKDSTSSTTSSSTTRNSSATASSSSTLPRTYR